MRKSLLITVTILHVFALSTLAQSTSVFAPKLQELYDQAAQAKPVKKSAKPVIGITTTLKNNALTVGYDSPQAVRMAGGIPILIPSTDDPYLIEAMLPHLDGVLVGGGTDVDPAYYGSEAHEMLGEVNEARDKFELMLIRKALEHNLPVFGICRGMQIINIALGGTLYQDIPSDFPESELTHRDRVNRTSEIHTIRIAPNTLAAQIFGTDEIGVNSIHHQCVKDIAPGLRITAWSPDGVPEMMEGYPQIPVFAMQSHPEIFTARNNDRLMLRFFELLVEKASRNKRRR